MRHHLPDSHSMCARRQSLSQERRQTIMSGTHQDRHADHFFRKEWEMPRVSIKQSKPMLARLSVTSPKT
jgi:hypothetical protein